MSYYEQFSNTSVNEGTATTTPTVITYGYTFRKILVINDSTTVDLLLAINGGSNFTIKPQETISIPMRVKQITLSTAASTADYRTLALG